MIKTKIIGLVVSLVLFGAMPMLVGFVPQASATTILDTTNGAFIFGGGGVAVLNEPGPSIQTIALPFSSATAVTITDINAYVGIPSLSDPPSGSVDIGIMATDSSGFPSGTFLFDQVVSLSNAHPIILGLLNWSISGGSTYWLAAVAVIGTDAAWQQNVVTAGPFAYVHQDNVWRAINGFLPEAIISSTPLPAALPLFATGLGALGLLGWCRKRKAAAIAA